ISKMPNIYDKKLLKNNLELIFLNACVSDLIAKDFSKLSFVNYAIGSIIEVEDDIALEFSKKFYEEYFSTENIEVSFQVAALTIAPDIYKLYKNGEQIK
ncbi:MAG TPA: hypothetical protein PLX69_23415, partial [Leptospiraceae bacterium]|nr:hypothetical protein [Leptospiraceae bacterium]